MADDSQDLVNATKKAAGWLTGTSAVKAIGDALTSKGETPAPAPAAKEVSVADKVTSGAAVGPTVQTVGEPVKTAPMKQNYSEFQE